MRNAILASGSCVRRYRGERRGEVAFTHSPPRRWCLSDDVTQSNTQFKYSCIRIIAVVARTHTTNKDH